MLASCAVRLFHWRALTSITTAANVSQRLAGLRPRTRCPTGPDHMDIYLLSVCVEALWLCCRHCVFYCVFYAVCAIVAPGGATTE